MMEIISSRYGGWRAFALLGAAVVLLVAVLIAAPARAAAAAPPQTDVMLLFDTSGSMSGELDEAKTEIKNVIAQVNASLPDVQYGVAEVRDFWPSVYDTTEDEAEVEGKAPSYPWKLDQPLTSNQEAVQNAINPLAASGGGDGPESYGRALWETDTNPNVAWRAGARHVIILVADNIPHDNNLNEGLPESEWLANPFETGEELDGTWNIPGTTWVAGDNTEFHHDLAQLDRDGKTLGEIEFYGGENGYLPYWQYWAGLTGGEAVNGGSGELATKAVAMIEARASSALPPCPTGETRNGSGVCQHNTATQVICNLVIATGSDTCTATVGDAATEKPTNPTGTVTFASSNGGAFPFGTTCTLAATSGSGNTSSCAVEYLPPTKPSAAPAISAAYGGDAGHAASAGSTTYPPAELLGKEISASQLGEFTGTTAEVPFECGFPCTAAGELLTTPSLAGLSSLGTVRVELPASVAKHKKKKKPVLLGKGTLKLSKAGKGKLVIHFNAKAKHVFAHLKGKVSLTLKFTVKTKAGTLVENKTEHVTLKPKKKKHKK